MTTCHVTTSTKPRTGPCVVCGAETSSRTFDRDINGVACDLRKSADDRTCADFLREAEVRLVTTRGICQPTDLIP